MTAQDLIDELSKYPPDTLIVKDSDNFELKGAMVDVRSIGTIPVVKEKRTFTDAFDYENYDKEVYKYVFKSTENHVLALKLND